MAANVDKLAVNDPRAQKRHIVWNGSKWYYLDAQPRGPAPPQGTIVLIHGFPDLSFGWRYQIPLLLSLGFRCLALDCKGYGDTGGSSAAGSAEEALADYSFRTHADVVAALARAVGARRIVLGGHDWGGLTVYRVAQWYPDLVSHVFSVCTAYVPPTEKFMSSEWLARTTLPQLGYQLQFGSADGQLENVITDAKRMRNFLSGIYGGRTQSGRRFMDPKVGVDLQMIAEEEIGPSPLLSEEEMDFYVAQFMQHGIGGPCNWYRTRPLNWADEQQLPAAQRRTVHQPTLYILATKDEVLTRELSAKMERNVPNLTRAEVPAGHWALWQTAAQTNAHIRDWIEGVVLGGKAKL